MTALTERWLFLLACSVCISLLVLMGWTCEKDLSRSRCDRVIQKHPACEQAIKDYLFNIREIL